MAIAPAKSPNPKRNGFMGWRLKTDRLTEFSQRSRLVYRLSLGSFVEAKRIMLDLNAEDFKDFVGSV